MCVHERVCGIVICCNKYVTTSEYIHIENDKLL